MRSYFLYFYCNGGGAAEINAENDSEAIAKSLQLLGGQSLTDNQWMPEENDDDGLARKKLYFLDRHQDCKSEDPIEPIAVLSTLGYVSPTGF